MLKIVMLTLLNVSFSGHFKTKKNLSLFEVLYFKTWEWAVNWGLICLFLYILLFFRVFNIESYYIFVIDLHVNSYSYRILYIIKCFFLNKKNLNISSFHYSILSWASYPDHFIIYNYKFEFNGLKLTQLEGLKTFKFRFLLHQVSINSVFHTIAAEEVVARKLDGKELSLFLLIWRSPEMDYNYN